MVELNCINQKHVSLIKIMKHTIKRQFLKKINKNYILGRMKFSIFSHLMFYSYQILGFSMFNYLNALKKTHLLFICVYQCALNVMWWDEERVEAASELISAHH